MANDALLYQEPGIVTILILTSFLLILNLVGYTLDKIIYCGLVGQIFIGTAWGKPGGHWLSTATQQVFVQLGYLGLILLVFEGGLSTNFKALKSNIFLSIFVAITGIGAPIGISFVLMSMADVTPLQAFAAGAALCSTSLGTTFTVLKTSGLTRSRLGVVLTSAAMLDDVVGLVMVQIISNLGTTDSSSLTVTVVRPIGVSLAFALVVPITCWVFTKLPRYRYNLLGAKWDLSTVGKSQAAFLIHTAILLAFVTASSYAGTSNLFTAYIAGASISWYDSEVANVVQRSSTPSPAALGRRVSQNAIVEGDLNQGIKRRLNLALGDTDLEEKRPSRSGERGMLPSPALSETGDVQGGENGSSGNGEATGEPATSKERDRPTISDLTAHPSIGDVGTGFSTFEKYYNIPVSVILKPLFFASIGFSIPISQMFSGSVIWRGFVFAILMALGKLLCGLWLVRLPANRTSIAPGEAQPRGRSLPRPKSLYPASILGCAMVARGEIGFLISAVAESRGIFSSAGGDGSSDLFLIVTWAIMLCTIAGPIAVGFLTRRMRRLQSARRRGGEEPLGIWGSM